MKLLDLINVRALLAGPALLFLASCGSYQYAGYEHDGIYSPENREAITANDHEESYEDALYYKQLFAEKSSEFGNIPEEGAVFTNIDEYSSAGMYEDEMFMDEGISYQGGNAPWGDQVDEISINVYGSSYYPYYSYSPFYNPYRPFFGYGYHSPYPYWGHGYGYGWDRWGYGYGYGHYSPWASYGWTTGWAMHNPYYGYGRYYTQPYYSNENVAYSTSRRNSYTDYDSNNLRSNSQARSNSRIRDYSNSRGIRAERSSAVLRSDRTSTDSRTYRTRTSRVESPQSRTSRSAVYSRSNSRTNERSTQARTQRSTRTSPANQVRRSTTTSRSSGTVRSSSSSSRSSGTRSSGSSRSRTGGGGGRGN